MVKRKEYRFRKEKIVEIQEFHDGNYGAPGKKRIKKKKPTEEQMRQVNADNKARRCRHKLLVYFHRGLLRDVDLQPAEPATGYENCIK